jgi:hypothetical protein
VRKTNHQETIQNLNPKNLNFSLLRRKSRKCQLKRNKENKLIEAAYLGLLANESDS